ncbi:hypothetical protein [Streptomyces sp. 020-2-3H-GM]|uniref:hypothetical protein n=1 Tax=Streptomyces sp. 020-2-3H-GM TaxID=2789258 RepID=UPI00397EF2A5
MSLHLTVRCDQSGPTGLCRESLPTQTDDEPEAIDIATRAGWDMGGGIDHCPHHAQEHTS